MTKGHRDAIENNEETYFTIGVKSLLKLSGDKQLNILGNV